MGGGHGPQLQVDTCCVKREEVEVDPVCCSEEHGLQLVLGRVEENSPAWCSGLRYMDTPVVSGASIY